MIFCPLFWLRWLRLLRLLLVLLLLLLLPLPLLLLNMEQLLGKKGASPWFSRSISQESNPAASGLWLEDGFWRLGPACPEKAIW